VGKGSAVRSRGAACAVAAVGVATAAIVLAGSTPATADPGNRPETAFALAGQGVLNFGPLTRTAAPDGNPAHAEVVGLAAAPGLAQAGISGGLLTSDAHTGYSATTVADLRMAELLSADAVKTTCENGRGKVEIGNGALLGTALPQFPVRGQTIDLVLAKATFGEEKRNADGTITVTGIRVSVLPTGALPVAGRTAVTPIAYVRAEDPDEGSDDSGDSQDTSADEAPVASPKPRTAATPPPASAAPKTTPAGPRPLGVPLPAALDAVPGLPNLPLPSLTAGQPVQTITIGSATCGAADQKPGGRPAGAGHDDPQRSAEDQEGSSVDDAPAPQVVEADLPVTG
jgi:hypothetical protein